MREIIARFLPRAFRRPVTAEEIDRYAGLMQRLIGEGESFETALRAGLRAVLCAPDFLFLSEPQVADGGPISDYALASRLSYFLWSTLPDAELLELAARGRLRDPEVRRAQVKRMLSSPKAAAFTDNFAGQWLKLRDLAENEPDLALYPEFDASARILDGSGDPAVLRRGAAAGLERDGVRRFRLVDAE